MKMKNAYMNELLVVVLVGSILTFGVYASTRITKSELNHTDDTDAQIGCSTSFFSINSPAGYTFNKGCIENNVQMYSTDSRFLFFLPDQSINNAAFVLTPNSEIKDSTTLSWSVTTAVQSTVYILTRHIPSINQVPNWIKNGYSRSTNDDLSHINQYAKRKNELGLIGIYDFYSRTAPAGTITFGAASDAQAAAYSMYIVAIVPGPEVSPTPSPTPTRTPSPTPVPTPTPDPLLEIAKLHNRETDCYVVYTDKTDGRHLYNITDYIKFHSGGKPSIVSGCGTDMTAQYDTGDAAFPEASGGAPHKHTNASNDILRIFMVQ